MTLTDFLITHGSALILPLAVMEGPVVSIVTGVLAWQGYFEWYWALFLLIAGDLVGDVIYYWIGRTGITPLASLRRRVGTNHGPPSALGQKLARNATKMLLIGKWTHSIGFLVLTALFWFGIGGILDLRLFFARLASMKRDVRDDGTVTEPAPEPAKV